MPRCHVCANELVLGDAFCDACGSAVGDAGAAAEAATAEAVAAGARKVVTIVFADLAGSTGQHERMDPESVRAFMERYYGVMTAAVESAGGRVIKRLGDGIMAAFGVPRVSEDDAVRALRAAGDMQVAFEPLAERARTQFGTPVGLRVGVNTGEVVVAADNDDVVGDAVNVAARLEQAAPPGAVLVGESTYRLARDAVTLEAMPPLSLRGKADPVRAWRLLSLDPPPTHAPVGVTPFVGRDAELQRLLALLDDVEADGTMRVVSVIGSPGVGKSRLCREVAAVGGDRARVFEIGCETTGGATFAPIADLLRQAARIDDDLPAKDVRSALLDLLPDDEPDRTRVAANAAALLGAGPSGSPEETFWAVRRMLAAIARDRPVIVIHDDLQWAEPMLLDLIEHVAEWGRDARVLLLAVARPELRDVRPSLTEGGRRIAGVIVLEGLGGEASQRLARDLLGTGELPAAIAGRLLASTEGNPLFLRELIRMLVDDGVLVRHGDAWTSTVDVADLDVPPTVHALLSARIERLDPAERLVLERAAVIGAQFPRGGVAALLPADVADGLAQHLEALRRRELVEADGSYWIDEPLYRFHHVLIRDAAYRGLLREARADLHERYARWLEEKAGDSATEQAEFLGFHLEQAHRERVQLGAAEDAIDAGRRAALWLVAAAHKAFERDDVGAAAGLFGRAIDCLGPDEPQRPSLLIERCEAVFATGDVATGAASLELLRAAAGGDERLAAWADCFAGQLANLTDPSRLGETMGAVEAAAQRLDALGDRPGVAKAHAVRARSLAQLGRIAECETALDMALAAARDAGDRRRANGVLGGAPLAALWGPSPVARASGRCLDVVRVLRITSGSPAVEATALRCQAVLEAYRGRDDAARRMLAAARALLEALGLRTGLLETDMFAGIVDLVAGDPVGAEELLRRAHEGFRELGVGVDAAQAAALLARAVLAQGRDAEAEQLTAEAEARGGQDLKTAIAWRSARAEALARRGASSEAVALARAAVAIAEPTDLVIDHADARMALAHVLRAAGQPDEADAEAGRAGDLYDRKGATGLAEQPPPVGELQPQESLPTSTALDNAAVRAARRHTAAADAHQWDQVAATVADDIVLHSRRFGVADDIHGVDEALRLSRYIHSVPVAFEVQPIATRGDRLALVNQPVSGVDSEGGHFEVLCLAVVVLDGAGLISDIYYFEPEDIDAAYAVLDDHYIAGEGAGHAQLVEQARAFTDAVNARDWDAVAARLHPDMRFVDHTSTSFGSISGRLWFETLRAMMDLAPDMRLDQTAIHELDGEVMFTQIRFSGGGLAGGPTEITGLVVRRLRDGLIVDMERFAEDDLAAARRRFDELRAGEGPVPLPNRALRVDREILATAEAGDWSTLRSMIAPDAVVDERRPTIHAVSRGPSEIIRLMRLTRSTGARVEHTPIATRGEDLALFKVRVAGPNDYGGDFIVELAHVIETDEEDRVVSLIFFELHDLDAAMNELDDRYEAQQSHPEAREVLRLGRRLVAAVNASDWESLAALLADEYGLIDHAAMGFGAIDKEEWIGLQRAARDADMRWHMVAVLGVCGRGELMRLSLTGSGLGGGPTEIDSLLVLEVRDRLALRLDRFPADQLDAALARFDVLRSSYSGYGSHAVLENAATRAAQRFTAAVGTGDLDALAGVTTEDIETIDRRRAIGSSYTGRGRFVLDIGQVMGTVVEFEPEAVAIRGDRLALSRARVKGRDEYENEFEVVLFNVIEVEEGGENIKTAILFDEDDLDAAVEELDDRFMAGEGSAHAEMLREMRRYMRSVRSGDWDDLAETLDPELVFVEQGPAGFGTLDASEYLVAQRARVELAPDSRVDIVQFHRLDEHSWLGTLRYTSSGLAGGLTQSESHMIAVHRNHRLTHAERLPAEQLDAAIRRYEELTEEG